MDVFVCNDDYRAYLSLLKDCVEEIEQKKMQLHTNTYIPLCTDELVSALETQIGRALKLGRPGRPMKLRDDNEFTVPGFSGAFLASA